MKFSVLSRQFSVKKANHRLSAARRRRVAEGLIVDG